MTALAAVPLLFLQAIQQTPCRDAACHVRLGAAAAEASDYPTAAGRFASACRLDPAFPNACYFWARALYAQDRFEASLEALAQAKPSATPLWMLLTARGQAEDALGRPAAQASLRRAWDLRQVAAAVAPTEPDPLLALAAYLHRQGQASESIRLLQAAPGSYRKLAAYHYQLGRALAELEQWGAAAESLRDAVSLRDHFPEAHGLLSRCYHALGNSAQAAFHTEKAKRYGSTTSR
jgi:tetratricopeptide (TPR) repeat protein